MAGVASVAVRAAAGAVGCAGHQEVEQARVCEGSVGCCSSIRGIQNVHRFGRESVSLGVEKVVRGFGFRAKCRWGFHMHGSHLSSDRRIGSLVYLVRGVNGAFWEGGDSESTANVHYPSQSGTRMKREGSLLLSLIEEIEPLDVSLISKDASSNSIDAMKRTISGILGILPSDKFQVTIETPSDHLGRLFVSSTMTGYTLRNAEYRQCLQRSLDLSGDDDSYSHVCEAEVADDGEAITAQLIKDRPSAHATYSNCDVNGLEPSLPEGLGTVSPAASNYIQQLEAKLAAASKELSECKSALSALEIVGQERNDLLDYLRSLDTEKVAELSQPTSPDVHEVVQHVVDEVLRILYSKESPSVPTFGANITATWEQDGVAEVVSNRPLQFQSPVTSTRDYLARLLFWCMLLGYHMRGVEYRLELSRTLSLSGEM